MKKKETQIPDLGFALKKSHFSIVADKITHEKHWDFTKGFYVAYMKAHELMAIDVFGGAIALSNGGSSVTILTRIENKKGITVATGSGSSNNNQDQNKYASNAQKASTFALKNAMERFIAFDQEVIDEMAALIGLDIKKSYVSKMTEDQEEPDQIPAESDMADIKFD